MYKMLVWFHYFPKESEVSTEEILYEQIKVSAFRSSNQDDVPKRLFRGSFKKLLDYIAENKLTDAVEVILPAGEVLYTKVSVPSKSRNRIMQAIPYILEDNLIDDIDKQFIALGQIKQGCCSIAIVRHFIIESVYAKFKALSIPISSMTSEALLLPWAENQWSLTLIENDIYIRTANQQGLICQLDNVDFVFQVLLNQSNVTTDSDELLDDDYVESIQSDKTLSEKPERINIYIQDKSLSLDKLLALTQKYDIDTKIEKGNLLQFALASNTTYDSQSASSIYKGINLLQGEFHPDTFKKNALPLKRTLFILFILWMFSQLSLMTYNWKTKSDQINTLEQSLEHLYFQTFPESKRLIDVRSQAQSHLKQLQNTTSTSSSFLNMTGLVGNELRKINGIKIKSLRYNDDILQLEVISKGFIFNQLKSAIESKTKLVIEEKTSSKVQGEVHSILNFKMKP